MSQNIRVGIIGCGKISNRHGNWFLEDPDCDIVALCDLDEANRMERESAIRELRPGAEIEHFSDYRRMLEKVDLDAVAVLLPHHLHFPVGLDTIRAGKHLLMEKPLTTDVQEARELMEAAEKANLVLGIAYQRNTMSEYLYVKRMIERGDFGKIQFLSAHLEQGWFHVYSSPGFANSWRSNQELAGGGQLIDSGSHTVSAVLAVTNLVPEEAFAYVENAGLPVDVNTVAAVKFQGNVLGSLTIGGFGHSVTEVLRIVGEKASARIFFRTVNEQALEIDGEVVEAKSLLPGTTPNLNFLETIRGNSTLQSGADLGLRVAQLTTALYTSATQNRPVRMEELE